VVGGDVEAARRSFDGGRGRVWYGTVRLGLAAEIKRPTAVMQAAVVKAEDGGACALFYSMLLKGC
jgi:hypothetical protein